MAAHSRILAWRIPWTEKPGEARRSKINMVMVGTMTIANTYLCLPSLDIVRTHTFLSGFFGHGSKRRLLLGRKVTTNLDSIFKSRDITSD